MRGSRHRRGGCGRWSACLAVVAAALALPALAGASMAEIPTLDAATAVACASASTCYVTGTDLNDAPALLPVVNGAPGSPVDFSDPNFVPLAIDCPDATHCLAVGNDVDPDSGAEVGAVATVTGGTPGAVQEVASASNLLAVGCASFAHCVAAGTDQPGNPATDVITSGQAQEIRDIPSSVFEPEAVACASASDCLVAGADGLPPSSTGAASVVTSGTPAAPVELASSAELSGVGCWSATGCVTAGDSPDGTDSFGDAVLVPSVTAFSGGAFGSSWTYPTYSDGGMVAVSCPSGTDCVALGDDDNGDVFLTPVENGRSGAAAPVAVNPSLDGVTLYDLSCGSASSCLAVGADAADNPVLASLSVPPYQSQAPGAGGGGTGSPPPTTPGPPASGRGGGTHRYPTRLLIAVTWPHVQPVPHLVITIRCQDTKTLAGVRGARIRLQERAPGSRRSAWRGVASALTSRVGAARFTVPALVGTRIEYRAVVGGSRHWLASASTTKTVSVIR